MTAPTFRVPHRRRNPLTGDWVLVSAQRTDRPWQGGLERPAAARPPRHDPSCYLCPGVERASGIRNPDYTGAWAFTNDFPALMPDVEPQVAGVEALFTAEVEAGTCRVVCFSPRHDLALSEMDVAGVAAVVDLWVAETAELGSRYRWVQVFENRGEAMGASNPHPHGQIWAGSAVPSLPATEGANQRAYHLEHGRELLADYLEAEERHGDRLVARNDEWAAVVPYWAVWPFETLLVPRRPAARLTDLDPRGKAGLADLLRGLLARYDNLFEHPFPYSMGWHGAPFDGEDAAHWRLHGHVFPPLLRSATIRKFMVGYELLSEAQRDLTPEEAAGRLRGLPDVHYLQASDGA